MSKEMSVCESLLNAAGRLWKGNKRRYDSEPWYNLFRRRQLRRELRNSERMYFWTMDLYYEAVAKHYNITEK